MSGIEVGNLNEIARVLADAARGFDEAGADAPDVPDAGASTGTIAELLASIADAMGTVTASAAMAADVVQANLGDYRAADESSGQQYLDVSGLIPRPEGE
ncbi:hypothetical protein [Prescottella sp. R16]|uniref:hypothetical protein n=1 Tax=Prescottella sp. R16 TaxID=3064529 RepID=UPI00272E3BFB|nr:hypothetical protein [Prescottella sp. R16]